MNWIELIQTALLVILVDRQLIIRNRYKFGINHNPPDNYGRGYWALWLLCKKGDREGYWRDGGKRLFYFHYGNPTR